MIYEIDFPKLITITLFTLLVTIFGFKKNKNETAKYYLLMLNFSTFVYSGLGLSYKGIESPYIPQYLIYILIQTITLTVISNKLAKRKKVNFGSEGGLGDKYLKQFVFLFFAVYIVRFIYPEFRLLEILNPILSIDNIFEKRELLRSNTIWEIFRYINIVLFPLFFIFLQKLKENNRKVAVIVIFVLWVYFETVSLGYISRNEMLVYGALLFLIVINFKNKAIKIGKKAIFTILIAGVLIAPLLLAYEYYRMGADFALESFGQPLMELVFKETDFPQYYDFAISIHEKPLITQYYSWFAVLPVPSFVVNALGVNYLEVNRFFTENLTGVMYGSDNYSVVLPSILGEAFMIYGKDLFWLHAIFVPAVISVFNHLLSQNEKHNYLNWFFIVSALTIARGGTTGYLANLVNSLIIYLIVSYILRKKNESNENISYIEA